MHSNSETKMCSTSQYVARLYLDYFNERLRIDEYRGNIDPLVEDLKMIAREKNFSKIIFHSRPEHWRQLLTHGFALEAIFSGYFNGTDNYTMAFYLKDVRRTSSVWVKEDDILAGVIAKGREHKELSIPSNYLFRRATEQDAAKLAKLYGSVFSIYPTPMNDESYVKKNINGDAIFYVAEFNQEIVSAASADVNKAYCHAELTDCATLPAHRKYGLMKWLLMKLEDELKKENIYCAFSIARALSFGMNAAFYQLGYTYKGRLTNNCYIFDKMEDMNVWVKDLSQ